MSTALALIVAGVVALVELLVLEAELLAWRNARRHRYSLTTLQAATGLGSRAELEAVVGAPGPDCLYGVPPERWAELPRQRWWWRIGDGPLTTLATLTLAVLAVAATAALGEPHWPLVLAALTGVAIQVALAALYLTLHDLDEERGEEPTPIPDDAELEGLGIVAGSRALARALDAELARLEAARRRSARHAGTTAAERLLFGALDRWFTRRLRRQRVEVARLVEGTEALAAEVAQLQPKLRGLISGLEDAAEAAELCELELRLSEALPGAPAAPPARREPSPAAKLARLRATLREAIDATDDPAEGARLCQLELELEQRFGPPPASASD